MSDSPAARAAVSTYLDAHTGDDPLEAVLRLHQLEDAVQDALRRAVLDARGNGESWAKVGMILEVSRQAAWERFKDLTKCLESTPHPDTGLEMFCTLPSGHLGPHESHGLKRLIVSWDNSE